MLCCSVPNGLGSLELWEPLCSCKGREIWKIPRHFLKAGDDGAPRDKWSFVACPVVHRHIEKS